MRHVCESTSGARTADGGTLRLHWRYVHCWQTSLNNYRNSSPFQSRGEGGPKEIPPSFGPLRFEPPHPVASKASRALGFGCAFSLTAGLESERALGATPTMPQTSLEAWQRHAQGIPRDQTVWGQDLGHPSAHSLRC